MPQNPALAERLAAFMSEHEHSQAAAARSLELPKDLINRAVSSNCALIGKNLDRLRHALDLADGRQPPSETETHQTRQQPERLPRLALEVVQFIAAAVAQQAGNAEIPGERG